MKKLILKISMCVAMLFSMSGMADSASLPGDYNGDRKVNLEDLAIRDSGGPTTHDANGPAQYGYTFRWRDDCGAFITTWDTSLADANTVTLALAGEVDAEIDWGDGSAAEYVNTPGPHVHDYGTSGIYTVSVTGSAGAYNSLDNGGVHYERDKLVSVDNWGQLGFTSMNHAFDGCSNLVSVPTTSDGLEAVTDMGSMFLRAFSFNENIGGWDTSNVTNMSSMFSIASSFNGNIGRWDTSSVGDMSLMFYYASSFNKNIGRWDTSGASDMSFMFANANAFNQDLDCWDTSGASDMYRMFYDANSFNGNIEDWDTSSVVNMSWMFGRAAVFNQDIGGWDTSSAGNMSGMFYDASSFNQDIGSWDTSSVYDMRYMFYDASAFNQDLSGWYVALITSEPTDFDTGATSWTEPRPDWGTCPYSCPFMTTWDTSLGNYYPTVTLALAGTVDATIYWGDSTVTAVTTPGPHTHNYGDDGIYTVSVTGSATAYNSHDNSGVYPYHEQAKLVSVDNWGGLGFISMSHAFHGCRNLVSVPADSDGIEAVTDMSYMFYEASSFNQDLSGWCVTNIPSKPYLFDDGATSWYLPRPVWGTCP